MFTVGCVPPVTQYSNVQHLLNTMSVTFHCKTVSKFQETWQISRISSRTKNSSRPRLRFDRSIDRQFT